MTSVILLVVSVIHLGRCLPPPHPDVVAVRLEEEQLPPNLRSPALHNPNLQEILPLSSLLHKGENLVFEREANNVPRKEIYNILTHAGFISRKKFPESSQRKPVHKNQQISVIPEELFNQLNFYESSNFPEHDYLQYL